MAAQSPTQSFPQSSISFKTIRENFTVTVEEHLRIERLAYKAHLSVSDYVRVRMGLKPTYRMRKGESHESKVYRYGRAKR